MTIPSTIPVLRDARLKGWPKHENGGAVEYRTLGDAMRASFTTDAHFAAYSAPSLARRLTQDALLRRDVLPHGVKMVAQVFDVDAESSHKASGGTESVAPDAWWLGELPKIHQLLEAHPGALVYRTRGGYRIVYALEGVVLRAPPDAEHWSSTYVANVAYLRRAFGIVADHACADWTRLFRAPRVVRDGRREVREILGGGTIGAWTYEPTGEDFDAAKSLRRARKKAGTKAASHDDRPAPVVGDGVLFHAFSARGELGAQVEPGKWTIACPWASEHTKGEHFDTSTVLFAPSAGEELGWPHCSHGHCSSRDLRDWLGHFTDAELAAARKAAGLETSAPESTSGYPTDWDVARGSSQDVRFRFLLNEEGRPRKNAANVMTVLCEDERWRGALAFDAFGECVVTLREPPMRASDRPGTYVPGEWTEEDSTRTAAWLCAELDLDVSTATVDQAVATAARRNVVHPVRDYLSSLAWDGTARLDTFLAEYFGAEDSAYTHGVGARWMISAVARIFEPGCQADCILVLESAKQGEGKSTGLEALAGKAWFADTGIVVGDKDSYQCLRRKWVYELGELDALKGREVTRTKSFLSARSDNYRPSYGRRNRDFPRQVVFAGTTNESQYLEDRTGNRRFWPVKVARVDVARLRADRDQLWAEARVRYEAGEPWHVDTPDFRELCEAEQADRTHDDPWASFVAGWLEGESSRRLRASQGGGLTSAQVIVGALSMAPQDISKGDEMRVAGVLRDLGWQRDSGKKLVAGSRSRFWRPVREVGQVGHQVGHQKVIGFPVSAQHAQADQPMSRVHVPVASHVRGDPGAPVRSAIEVGQVGHTDDGHAFSDLIEVAE